ncbi:helix-turn-helix domain-containing protein [Chloroflexota bacterium]
MNTPIFISVPQSKGSYFRMERAKLGLRQTDIAAMAGIPQSYVSLAERDNYIPHWALERLEKALGFNNGAETGNA